jgi:hypothetical protein
MIELGGLLVKPHIRPSYSVCVDLGMVGQWGGKGDRGACTQLSGRKSLGGQVRRGAHPWASSEPVRIGPGFAGVGSAARCSPPRRRGILNGVLVEGHVEGLDCGTGRPGERPYRHSTRVRITLLTSVITII